MIVLVPSRSRPKNAWFLAEQFNRTAYDQSHPPLLIFGVDDDDATLPEYRRCEAQYPFVGVYEGPRLRMGPTLNVMARHYAGEDDIVGFMGDDHRPNTHGWDKRIENALAGSMLAYGNDLVHGQGLPTAVFMWSHVVKSLGYMVPEGMIHLYLDNFWLELGKAVGIQYLPDVVIEHAHPIAHKAEWDDTYREANAGEVYEHDRIRFEEYMATEFTDAVERVRP